MSDSSKPPSSGSVELSDEIKKKFLEGLLKTLDVKAVTSELGISMEDGKSIIASLNMDLKTSPQESGDCEELTAYFDGGSRGNPGVAGAGAFIVDNNKKPVKKLKKYLGVATNNVAEYESLLMALNGAVKLGCKKITVYGDSELVIKQVKGQYKVKNETLKVIYKKVMGLITQFDSFEISHIPREKNGEADRLANSAMDEKK